MLGMCNTKIEHNIKLRKNCNIYFGALLNSNVRILASDNKKMLYTISGLHPTKNCYHEAYQYLLNVGLLQRKARFSSLVVYELVVPPERLA